MKYYSNQAENALNAPQSNFKSYHRTIVLLRLLFLFFVLSCLAAANLQAGKPAPPAAPSGLAATAVSANQVNLTWRDNSSDESGFFVQRATSSSGPWTQIASVAAGVTSYSDIGLSTLATYYYRVCAYNSRGNSSYSNTASAATPDTMAPSVPNGLAATAASSSQINLSWGAATDSGGSGLAGYKIYRSGVQIGTSTTTSYSNTGLTASTSYCYTVAAYDNAGNTSAQSTQACATTAAVTDTTAPTVPNGLAAAAASSSQINLSWSATTDTGGSGLAGYKIYRSGVQIGTATTTSYSNTGLSASTSYCYTVAAYDSAGNTSAPGTQACATTPAAADTTASSVPSGLTATAASSSQINLSWSSATDTGGSGLAGYKIYRSGAQIGTSATTSYSNTGLPASTTYCYTVAAYDNAGNTSAQTAQACAITLGDALPSVSLTSPANGATVSGAITVAANASDGNGVSKVEFYRDGSTLVGSDTTSAYAVSFDTSGLANGSSHYFQAKAYDMAGNWTMSAANNVTVNNGSTAGPWAKSFGSAGTDYGTAVAVDGSGNIFVAGVFSSSVDFSGNGTGMLTSAGGYDVFLTKYTAAGAHVWSKQFGGIGSEVVKSIALDSSGNIFICGNLITGSIAKFSATGNLLWTAGPAGADFVSIATDSQGNVVATGNFVAPWANQMAFGGGIMLYSQFGGIDTFLAKYSAAGACLWAKAFLDNGDAQYGTGVAVDKRINPATSLPYDNILVAGYGTGRINLGGADLSNNVYGNNFGFLGKFLPSGTHVWSRRVGTANSTDTIGSSASRTHTMAIDGNGDVVLAGIFAFHTNLGGEPVDSGNVVISGTSSFYDMFVAKYSGASGSYQWSKAITGNQYGTPQSIVADVQNNVIVSGNFYGTYTFGTQTLTTAGSLPKSNSDGFVAKLSSGGSFVWAQLFGGVSDGDGGKSVAVDPTGGYPVVTGAFQSTATLGSASLTSAGGMDLVLGRLNP